MAYLLLNREPSSDQRQRTRNRSLLEVPPSVTSSPLPRGYRSLPSTDIKPKSLSSSHSYGRYIGLSHPTQGSPNEAAAITDAELYASVTDFTDIMEILQAPTVPPTKMGFAHSPPLSFQRAPVCSPTEDPPKNASTGVSAVRPPCSFEALTFGKIAANNHTGVEIFSAAVEGCPIHLMRASAIMPCSPADLLRYMDSDVRPAWDSHLRGSRIVRRIQPAPCAAAPAPQTSLIVIHPAAAAAPIETSLSRAASDLSGAPPPMRPPTTPSPTRGTTAEDDFQYRPGQRRVAVHYMELTSPIPLMQPRDLELLVCEEVTPDGCAVMKAFSTPMGVAVPMDPAQTRYVRAVVLLSGLLARPLPLARGGLGGLTSLPPSLRGVARRDLEDTCSGARKEYCVLEYLGLVHPMGLVPPVLTNMVISAQLSVLGELQRHISQHPIFPARLTSPLATPVRNSSHGLQNNSHFSATPTESFLSVSTHLGKTHTGESATGLLEDATGTTPSDMQASQEAASSDGSHPNSHKNVTTGPSRQDLPPGGLTSSVASNPEGKQSSTVVAMAANQPPTSTDPAPCDGEHRCQRASSVETPSDLSRSVSTKDLRKKGKVRFWWSYVKKQALSKL